MKLGVAIGLALLAAPLGLAAQNSNSAVAHMMRLDPCPVGVRAQHLGDGKMVKTGNNHPTGFGLHVALTSPDQRTIASAILDESGPTGAGITMKTGANDALLANANKGADTNKVAWATRTIQVQFAPGTGRTASADVYAEGLTAVLSIDVSSVTFTDGSTWTPDAGRTCRVAPDPLMLVATGRR